MKLSTRLYKAARLTNDLENLSQGPMPYVKRRVRRPLRKALRKALK